MQSQLQGIRVAVLGGDRREWIVTKALQAAGASVRCIGLPSPGPTDTPIVQFRDIASALSGCHAAIAPLSGTDASGIIRRCAPDSPPLRLDVDTLGRMAAGGLLLIGTAVPAVRQAARQVGVEIIETENDDELAILNSVPTAEGALQLAMERLPVTIHGSHCVVFGFGRCGLTLAMLLARVGAHVTVVARDPDQRARAESLGLESAALTSALDVLRHADAIFNTVPARVLQRDELAVTRPDVVIIDIAAEPGGVDFEAAQALDREAHLALGLPGKVAPVTAGHILSRCLLRMLSDRLQGRNDVPGREGSR